MSPSLRFRAPGAATGGPYARRIDTTADDLDAVREPGAGAALAVIAEPDGFATAEVTGAGLERAGVAAVLITERVVLSPRDPVMSLGFLRFLREATATGVPVGWCGRCELDCAPVLLRHLPPPQPMTAPATIPDGPHRFGLCHYRAGPGFVLVTDRRTGRERRTTLRDPEVIGALTACARPAPAEDVPPVLIAAGLVLPVAGQALTLPYRLRRWPIPCTDI